MPCPKGNSNIFHASFVLFLQIALFWFFNLKLMKAKDQLFNEFPPIDKETWLAKVEKDLKGKPLADLNWQLGEDIELAPFYHPDDMQEQYAPLIDGRRDNDWQIGEYVNVDAPKAANQQLLQGLNGGVEAPLFRLYQHMQQEDIAQLLDGVHPNMVSLNFGEYYVDKQPKALFELITGWLKQQQADPQQAGGSLDFDPLLDWSKPPIDTLAEMMNSCASSWPHFRVLQINARQYHGGPEEAVNELAMTIAKGSEYLHQLQEQGVSPTLANKHLQFGIAISKSYFVEIAKLRALRLLWANVLKAYGAEHSRAQIIVHFAPETQDEQTNTNIIRASTQAMSAVMGGADRLYVLPSNHINQEGYTEFSLRIARNLQHLLKMESHLHRVIDPGAGSYYIEQLTNILADRAWAQFQELEQQQAFAQ
jgi:methylmalonyl-CoA mutase